MQSSEQRRRRPAEAEPVRVRRAPRGQADRRRRSRRVRLRRRHRRAGADPGPACYSLGGQEPTITDADLIIGKINPDNFASGKIKLFRKKSELAIREKISKPLKLNGPQAVSDHIEFAMPSGKNKRIDVVVNSYSLKLIEGGIKLSTSLGFNSIEE